MTVDVKKLKEDLAQFYCTQPHDRLRSMDHITLQNDPKARARIKESLELWADRGTGIPKSQARVLLGTLAELEKELGA